MAKAQRVRQKHLVDVELGAKGFPAFSEMEISDTPTNEQTSQAMEFTSIPLDALNALDNPPDWLKGPEIIQGTFNWDPWLVANAEIPGLMPIDMTYWENFVTDFQGGELPQGQQDLGPSNVQQ